MKSCFQTPAHSGVKIPSLVKSYYTLYSLGNIYIYSALVKYVVLYGLIEMITRFILGAVQSNKNSPGIREA